MTDVVHTFARIERFLKEESLDDSKATVVLVAVYASQADLTRFKPGWQFADYNGLITALHLLCVGKKWTLNSHPLVREEDYQEFNAMHHGVVSRAAYVLAVLGYVGSSRKETARGVSPIVITNSGSTKATVLYVD